MSRGTLPQRLIAFFDPAQDGTDPQGRKLKDIISWPDDQLEFSHDYIQTTFPLPEGSMFNAAIWLVDKEVFAAFRERAELKGSANQAFARICAFYGLRSTIRAISNHDGTGTVPSLEIVRADNFGTNKKLWLSSFNHNHLRITRILRSLRVLGLDEQAKAFHTFLETDPDVAVKVSPRSRMYWTRAAHRPLRLPPDEDDDAAVGIEWLKGY